jgi:hypothetical protein
MSPFIREVIEALKESMEDNQEELAEAIFNAQMAKDDEAVRKLTALYDRTELMIRKFEQELGHASKI